MNKIYTKKTKSNELVFRHKGFVTMPYDKIIVDKHCQYGHSEKCENTKHNDHFSSPLFSMVSARNKTKKNKNTVQNINFCKNDNLEKNSPAKYPANIILAKSPISFDNDSLDFKLNHCIVNVKNNILLDVCQGGNYGIEREKKLDGADFNQVKS